MTLDMGSILSTKDPSLLYNLAGTHRCRPLQQQQEMEKKSVERSDNFSIENQKWPEERRGSDPFPKSTLETLCVSEDSIQGLPYQK